MPLPDDPAAIDALIWIATEDMYWKGGELALTILAEKHAGSPQVAEYASQQSRYGGPFAPYEKLLRAAYGQKQERNVHAAIGLTLARYLKMVKENLDEKAMVASIARQRRNFEKGICREPESRGRKRKPTNLLPKPKSCWKL